MHGPLIGSFLLQTRHAFSWKALKQQAERFALKQAVRVLLLFGFEQTGQCQQRFDLGPGQCSRPTSP